MIIELDKKNFNEYISKGLQVVVFSAKWCSYCQKQFEVLRELNNIKIGKVDGDASPNLVGQFGIMGFPTFIIFKNGEVLTKFSGYKNKFELMNILSKYL
ncbi:MAG: thioredoxin family protein [Candidatus Gastranaerophilaceae bacterium]